MADTTVRIKFDAKDNVSRPFQQIASNIANNTGAVKTVLSQIDGQLGSIVGRINGTAKSLRALGASALAGNVFSIGFEAIKAGYDIIQRYDEKSRQAALDAANARIDAGRRVLDTLKAQTAEIDRQLRAANALADAARQRDAASASARRAGVEAHWLAIESRNGPLDARQSAEKTYSLALAGLDDREDAANASAAAIGRDDAAARAALKSVAARRSAAIAERNALLIGSHGDTEAAKAARQRIAELDSLIDGGLAREKADLESRIAANKLRMEAVEQTRRAIAQERENAAAVLKIAKDRASAEAAKRSEAEAAKAREDRERRLGQAARERSSREGALRSAVERALTSTVGERMAGARAMGAADVSRIRALIANGTLRGAAGGWRAETQDAAERRARKTESYQDEMKRIAREIRDKFSLSDEEYNTLEA